MKAARYLNWQGRTTELKTTKGARIYEKADKNGELAGELPEDAKVRVEYATQGLNDEDWYWSVWYAKPEGPLNVISGYMLESDLSFD
jgi:hypothetical protein